MKVCFLTPHTRVSGGVKVIFRLANRLQKIGCKVTVLAEKINDKNMFWFGEKFFFRLAKYTPEYLVHNLQDVVVDYGDRITAVQIPNPTKKVLLLQNFGLHNVDIEEKNLSSPYHAVVCVSSWLAQIAKEHKQTKVFVVHPGIDPIFQPKPPVDKPTVPVIGSLYHKLADKNFPLFLDSMKCLCYNKKVAVKALILAAHGVGPIFELDSFSINYSIFCNPPQYYLPFMYSNCTIWMSPSIREGFGLTTVEAMACGCPVVTTRNKGLDDYLVNEQNCMIVKTPEKAAEAMLTLIKLPGLRMQIVRGGIQLAKKFSWRVSAEQFFVILREIVKTVS